jgi:tRNA(Ser,Leu) C12 N-acetylase TAN1
LDHVVEAIHRLEVQGSTREEELRKLIEEEANARATAAEDLRSRIARLDDRLDALMRQKRGEAGIGNSIGVN